MSLTQKEKLRYDRHIQLEEIGLEGQEKLKNARVLVIGAGGLGCAILQYLSSCGIGTIGIVDYDTIDESNLQRQVLFDKTTVGEKKAKVAKEKLKLLNPLISITDFAFQLNHNNAIPLFKEYDLIVDGTDNFATRYLINDASVLANKPFVYGSIHRFEGQVSVFNYKNGPTYRCLFPDPPKENTIPNCSESGVLGILPGIIGTYQANEVLKVILEIGEPLSGKLLLINILTNQSSIIKIKRSKEQIRKVMDGHKTFIKQNFELLCNDIQNSSASIEIDASQLTDRILNGDKIKFIDIRSAHELPKVTDFKAINLPDSEILNNLNLIDSELPVVIFCQSGRRSYEVVKLLSNNYGLTNIVSLIGGVKSWLKYNEKINVPTNENI